MLKDTFDNQEEETVYGRYSLGSGAVLSDPDQLWDKIDAPDIIQSYKSSITIDLEKSGIPLDKLKDFGIMDVGTGRQAIAFYQLGAKFIKHYDLSPSNVDNMHGFIREHSLEDRITSECGDLVKYPLPKEKFDLVYLNGVAQNFSNVSVGLKNCIQALKEGGYFWLYFYRSGTFTMFVIYLIRDLIGHRADAKEYFVNSTLLYSDFVKPNFHVSNIMDDFFIPYMHLYTPKSYIAFVQKCGFEIVSSSKLDPFGKEVDHRFAYPSVVLTCQKIASTDLSQIDDSELSPENAVDQLDPRHYASKEIGESISSYQALKDSLSSRDVPDSVVMSIAFRLYSFVQSVDYGAGDGEEGPHKKLQRILKNTIALLHREY